MRKLLTATLAAAFMLMIAIPAMAQQGEMKLGPTLNFGTSSAGSLGIGAKFVYGISDKIDLVPEFIYYLKKDFYSQMLINADAAYTFTESNQYKFYGIAGLTAQLWSVDWDTDLDLDYEYEYKSDDLDDLLDASSSGTNFGINAGVGTHYFLSDNMHLVGEARYVIISDYAQLLVTAGILFKL
jgi:hypothetical protein